MNKYLLIRTVIVLAMTLLIFRFISGGFQFHLIECLVAYLIAEKLTPQLDEITK